MKKGSYFFGISVISLFFVLLTEFLVYFTSLPVYHFFVLNSVLVFISFALFFVLAEKMKVQNNLTLLSYLTIYKMLIVIVYFAVMLIFVKMEKTTKFLFSIHLIINYLSMLAYEARFLMKRK